MDKKVIIRSVLVNGQTFSNTSDIILYLLSESENEKLNCKKELLMISSNLINLLSESESEIYKTTNKTKTT